MPTETCPDGHETRVDNTGQNGQQKLYALHPDGQGGVCRWSATPPRKVVP